MFRGRVARSHSVQSMSEKRPAQLPTPDATPEQKRPKAPTRTETEFSSTEMSEPESGYDSRSRSQSRRRRRQNQRVKAQSQAQAGDGAQAQSMAGIQEQEEPQQQQTDSTQQPSHQRRHRNAALRANKAALSINEWSGHLCSSHERRDPDARRTPKSTTGDDTRH